MVGQARGQDALVADRAVREDQDGAGMAQGEVDEALGERRQAASGVDQDRHAGALGEAEHAVHLLAVEHEVLGSRVQLDAARAGRQAAFALGERVFGRVEPAERHQPPVAFARPREHAVVGQAVGGVALGVVQREHARPARPGRVEQRQQLRQGQRAPVLVQPQVRVGVDDFGVGRAQALDLGEERGQRVGVEGVVHARDIILSSWPSKL